MRPLLIAAALLSAACSPRVIRHRAPDPPPLPINNPPVRTTTIDPPQPASIAPAPIPAPTVEVKPPRNMANEIAQANATLLDAYFDYDRAEVAADALAALHTHAAILEPLLRDFPDLEIVVEGHCDERGSAEYNLGLGARRAEHAAAVLETLGISSNRLRTISYGSERPQCDTPAESCWRLNRRAHLELRPPQQPRAVSSSW